MQSQCGCDLQDGRGHPYHDAVEQVFRSLDTPDAFRDWLGERREITVGVTCSEEFCPLSTYLAEELERATGKYLVPKVSSQAITVSDEWLVICALGGRTWRYHFVEVLDNTLCRGEPYCGQTNVSGARALQALDDALAAPELQYA